MRNKFTFLSILCFLIFTLSACSNNQSSRRTTNFSTTVYLQSEVSKNNKFDLERKTLTLNDGNQIPIYGLGTYSLQDETCVTSVVSALQNGGSLIDTAYMYHNEESVGEGLKKSGIPRQDAFITTKLYMTQFDNAENAIEDALDKLQVDYIDLMLLHHPGENDVKAYKAMESAVKEGKIRSIGLSNYYIDELDKFLPQIEITPTVVQNEIHSYYQDNDVVDYIQSKGIAVEAWFPLGGRGHTKELFGDLVIQRLSEQYKKTPAQIILRWHLQRNIIAIPGSSNPAHIKENMDILDFTLSSQGMEKIGKLDRDEKHEWY